MTIIHETFSIYEEPEHKHEPFDAFKDLRGRSPEEIRGIIAILFAEERAHTHPGILLAMHDVQSDTATGEHLFVENTIQAIEKAVLDRLNQQHADEAPSTGADDGVSDLPPEA